MKNMFKSGALCFFVLQTALANTATPTETSQSEATPAPSLEGTSIPRYVPAPTLKGSFVGASSKKSFEYASSKFNVVWVLGTWNDRSKDIVKLYLQLKPKFKNRPVRFVGLFTQDTLVSVAKWKQELGADFDLILADLETTKAFENPKVPSIFVVSDKGYFFDRLVMPSDKDVSALLERLLLWTNF